MFGSFNRKTSHSRPPSSEDPPTIPKGAKSIKTQLVLFLKSHWGNGTSLKWLLKSQVRRLGTINGQVRHPS